MPAKPSLLATSTPVAVPDPPPTNDAVDFECYCGLGLACPMFGQMNAAQRADCTRDKRQTAQWMFVNGMTE